MIDCLFGALAQALPGRVPADSCGGATLIGFGGYHENHPFVYVETFMGNFGGTSTHDGQEGVPHMGANQANVPVELVEMDHPLHIVRYGLVPDTGGAGRFRGGLSLIREFKVLADEALLTVRSDKRRYLPHGLLGGKPGSPSWNIINPDQEKRVLPVLLTDPEIMKQGEVYRHIMAGGGGYGDPLDRDPKWVLRDVLEEKVSLIHAKEAYGVVFHNTDPPSVDPTGTARLRTEMRATRR
jgi:N-methylhydantoinase B